MVLVLPYLGQAKSSPDRFGLCYYCALTEDQKLELYNLIKDGEANVLQRAMLSIAQINKQYASSYFDTEVFNSVYVSKSAAYSFLQLWCYSTPHLNIYITYSLCSAANHDSEDYWHESPNDETEHATFRLFDDAPTNPWNYRTYHLYKDGTSRSWAYQKWEAEERPT